MSEKAMVSRSFQVFWWNIPYIGIKFENLLGLTSFFSVCDTSEKLNTSYFLRERFVNEEFFEYTVA